MNDSEMLKKKSPIQYTNFQWAVKRFCSATACSRGFIWFSADRCRGEAFRLINCPHRVGERQEEGEGIAKCSHVYPLSKDPLLRAHSLSSLALSSSTYTPTLSPLSLICRLLPAAVLNSCTYSGWKEPQVDGEGNVRQHSAGAFFPTER